MRLREFVWVESCCRPFGSTDLRLEREHLNITSTDMFIILSRAKAVPARVPMGRNGLLISDPGRRAAVVSRIMAEILA